jgi:hypothetical protein
MLSGIFVGDKPVAVSKLDIVPNGVVSFSGQIPFGQSIDDIVGVYFVITAVASSVVFELKNGVIWESFYPDASRYVFGKCRGGSEETAKVSLTSPCVYVLKDDVLELFKENLAHQITEPFSPKVCFLNELIENGEVKAFHWKGFRERFGVLSTLIPGTSINIPILPMELLRIQ